MTTSETETPELVKEYPTFLSDKYPFRLYRTRYLPFDLGKPIEEYRYYFGFPKELIEPVHTMLQTTVFWGETYKFEHEGFWLWRTFQVGKPDEKPDFPKLTKELKFMLEQYNDCLGWYGRASESAKLDDLRGE